MRDVVIVAKCDKCFRPIEHPSEGPLDKWTLNGEAYRPELCPDCTEQLMSWLETTRVHTRNGSGPSSKKSARRFRTGGRFSQIMSTCPVEDCGKTFTTPAGLSQHLTIRSRRDGWEGESHKEQWDKVEKHP